MKHKESRVRVSEFQVKALHLGGKMGMTTHEMIAATIKLLDSLHRDCLKRSRAARARAEGSE